MDFNEGLFFTAPFLKFRLSENGHDDKAVKYQFGGRTLSCTTYMWFRAEVDLSVFFLVVNSFSNMFYIYLYIHIHIPL